MGKQNRRRKRQPVVRRKQAPATGGLEHIRRGGIFFPVLFLGRIIAAIVLTAITTTKKMYEQTKKVGLKLKEEIGEVVLDGVWGLYHLLWVLPLSVLWGVFFLLPLRFLLRALSLSRLLDSNLDLHVELDLSLDPCHLNRLAGLPPHLADLLLSLHHRIDSLEAELAELKKNGVRESGSVGKSRVTTMPLPSAAPPPAPPPPPPALAPMCKGGVPTGGVSSELLSGVKLRKGGKEGSRGGGSSRVGGGITLESIKSVKLRRTSLPPFPSSSFSSPSISLSDITNVKLRSSSSRLSTSSSSLQTHSSASPLFKLRKVVGIKRSPGGTPIKSPSKKYVSIDGTTNQKLATALRKKFQKAASSPQKENQDPDSGVDDWAPLSPLRI